MKMPKPTEDDKARFRALAPDQPNVEVKPMFGNLGGFVNGNMFMGLFGSAVGLKLAEEDRQQLEGIEGSGPFGPDERPMGGYVSLPADMPDAEAAAWVGKALTYVSTLPPKARK